MLQATIPDGEAVSNAIDLPSELRAHHIVLPAGWATNIITFQSSDDGVTYTDLYSDGGEYSIPAAVAVASRTIVLDPTVFLGISRFKIRSGTSAVPANQSGGDAISIGTVFIQ